MGRIEWQQLFDVQLAIESLPYILQGTGYTILISFGGMAIGLLLGFLLALMRNTKKWYVDWPARLFISYMRGTPMLVFLFILYFGLPTIGIQFSAITAALIGFSLHSSAYMAEIIRAALNAIDQGQWEASQVLGLKKWQTLLYIYVPQATRIAIPPLANVLLDLIKASSLAAMITVPDLFHRAKIVGGREFDYMTVYLLVGFIYWGMSIVVESMQLRLEKRFAYEK